MTLPYRPPDRLDQDDLACRCQQPRKGSVMPSVSARFLAASVLLSGCAVPPRDLPAPRHESYHRAEVEGFEDIRFFGDEPPPFLDNMIADVASLIRKNPEIGGSFGMLALSGGADDGAYGAGLLKGWTDRGDRPAFTWVTGVSTGALMAPFAFLGAEYDDTIRRFYTETAGDGIVLLQPLTALFGGASLGDTAPLRAIIAEEIDAALVRRLAAEYEKGRLLLIGTTNLDAQRPVIWNLGRIASYGPEKKAETLIEDILMASAAIPGVFPPVAFDVVIDGERYQELHGDGGVTFNVFAYPAGIDLPAIERDLGVSPEKSMWVVRNTKLEPDYRVVEGRLPDIAGRAISTMIKYQGRGDIVRIEQLARRDGFDFRLAAVPQDFDVMSDDLFDPVYMRALYERGYRDALSATAWRDSFSGLARPEGRLR